MPLRNVATTFTIEQQRLEINNLAGDVNNIATGVTATTASGLAAGATGADLTLSGTLTVNGTQTILNTETLQVEDKEIVIGNVSSPTDATAHGGGWKLKGANNKTITYNQTGDKWESNKNFEAPNLAYTTVDQTFSGNLTIQKGSADNADLMIGATGTGEARIYLDASNGDFSGGDYGYFKQTDAGILKIGNMNAGGILFNVGEGSGGAGTALSIINNGNVGIGTSTPNRNLEIYKDAAQASIGIIANTTGQSSLWLGNTGDNNVGGIYYEHDNNALEFRVNDDQHLSLTNTRLKLKHIDLQIQTDGNTPTLEFQGSGSNKLGEINSDAINGTTSQMRFYIEESGSLVQKLTIKTDGIHDSKGPLRNVPTSPLSGTHAGGYVMLVSDSGKCVAMSGDVTLQSAGQGGPFGGGDVITILNASASAITLNQGNGLTLYNSGTGNTGDCSLGARGIATVIYMYGGNSAYISGAQLT